MDHPWIGPLCICGATKDQIAVFCWKHWHKLKVADKARFAERIIRPDTTLKEWQEWYDDILNERLKGIKRKES